MSDQERIDELDVRIHELEKEHELLRQRLVQAQLDQWQGRIDDLDVQAHLGGMELRDRLEPLIAELRSAWLVAKSRADTAANTSAETLDALQIGLERAMADIRDALAEAGRRATGSSASKN